MIICAAGDIHGAIDRLYEDVSAFEVSLGVHFEWVLQVGDFGVWPHPNRVDSATKRHEGAGDFPVWWTERRVAPHKTLFIKGNHEDFVWLDAQPSPEILQNLFYLRNGKTFDLGGVVVGGVGGCYGPSNYNRRSVDLRSYAKRHYTRNDIDTLLGVGPVDILLTHDAPAGVVFERHRCGPNWASTAKGLDDLVRGVHSRICFFGHHHTRLDSRIDEFPCIGLNKIRRPGNLVAFEISDQRLTILDDWPHAR